MTIYITFAPNLTEVLNLRIRACDTKIRVSLPFIDSIIVLFSLCCHSCQLSVAIVVVDSYMS